MSQEKVYSEDEIKKYRQRRWIMPDAGEVIEL